jgi:gluconolactonase
VPQHLGEASAGTVTRLDPSIDAIVPAVPRIERIATGFMFTEGPICSRDGYLLFSDIPGNVIRKWTPSKGAVDFRRPSGYTGTDAPAGAFIGSNGMTLDPQGRLTICEHGHRRLTRLEPDGAITVLAERYQGRRLNSPNDVIYKSNGVIYFTDPPYGLVHQDEDPKKELSFNGIFRLDADGTLTLLEKSMTRPNGLAFSPDEKYMYVANSDDARRLWMRFRMTADGALTGGEVFADVTHEKESGNPDGLKIDIAGNLYGTGPGGVWIFSPDGRHLGTIKLPEIPANVHWGKWATSDEDAPMRQDEDATTLYMTAETSVYRIELKIPGIRP